MQFPRHATRYATWVILMLTAWVLPARAVAQASVDSIPKDLLALSDLRGFLGSEVAALETQISRLRDSLSRMQEWARDDDYYAGLARSDSTRLANKARRTDAEESQLRDASDYLRRSEARKALPRLLGDSITAKSDQLAAKKRLASEVQRRILATLSPEQGFKMTMSMVFAALIGLVIAGFFVLAVKDAKLREKVFGGQAGMQFLTLFSLIIAIILFGITGILEGKELAALLGGLSGYILGRSGDTKAEQEGAGPKV